MYTHQLENFLSLFFTKKINKFEYFTQILA